MQVPPINGPWLAGLLGVLLILSVIDVRSRRIPNAWVAVLFGTGIAHAFIRAGGWAPLAALAGAALGVSLLLWQHSKGLIGAGDVKLLGALGTWTGPVGVVVVLLAASVLGGLLSLLALVSLGREQKHEVRANLLALALARGPQIAPASKLTRARGIPFGVALSAAAAGFFLHGGLP